MTPAALLRAAYGYGRYGTEVRLQARDKIRADDASGGDGEYARAGAIAGVGVNLGSSAAGEFD